MNGRLVDYEVDSEWRQNDNMAKLQYLEIESYSIKQKFEFWEKWCK